MATQESEPRAFDSFAEAFACAFWHVDTVDAIEEAAFPFEDASSRFARKSANAALFYKTRDGA